MGREQESDQRAWSPACTADIALCCKRPFELTRGCPVGPPCRWVSLRSDNVKAIMKARMTMCRDKGFVAVDPDNVDGYSNANGLGLTAAEQIAYNKWIAATAHELGLAVGLKNDVDQIADLVNSFDFFVNE